MNTKVQGTLVKPELLQAPQMNFGQLQRWNDFVPLDFEIEFELEVFLEKFEEKFTCFRKSEIEDDDSDEFPELPELPELAEYKQAGWLQLYELVEKHPDLLAKLIKYHEHDVLLGVSAFPIASSNYYYSMNGITDVIIRDDKLTIFGICFQSDYIEHSFNSALPTKYALLK